ncbi:MAG: DUF1818 family protein [Cyanobacteriota bacterium]|nr:DUF1818 family protein [Cyanobacteriota bacterium]
MFEREGDGWRLAWDPQRDPFPWLIGGDGWASELTAAEGQALFQALTLLRGQHQRLADTLMEEEAIEIDYTGTIAPPPNGVEGSLWVTLDGDRQTWALRFVLQPPQGQRGLEGGWPREAAVPLLRAWASLESGDGGLGAREGETRLLDGDDQ